MPLATAIEDALARRDGVIVDDRGLPLFALEERLRDGDLGAYWRARVVDAELLAQGAPSRVILQAVSFADELGPTALGRALEATIIDHPRIQLCHSVAMPSALLAKLQPDEPSALLPPLHVLPLCDEVPCLLLVKEDSDGIPLLSWRQQRGEELERNEILDLLDTVAEALAALHRRGFSHGALTPESIVLQEVSLPQVPGEPVETVWVPKLVDIGLVRTLTQAGTFPSGPATLWCAPEVFAPDLHTDWRRADQLGLAAILYALWTDQVPFDQIPADIDPAAARELRRRQIEALPPPRGNARARALGVTPTMSAACLRALSADAADRYPSVDAFSAALRAALREAGRTNAGRDPFTDPQLLTVPGTQVTSKFRSISQPKPTIEVNPARVVPASLEWPSELPHEVYVRGPQPGDFTPLPVSHLEQLLRKGDLRAAKVNPLTPPVEPDALPAPSADSGARSPVARAMSDADTVLFDTDARRARDADPTPVGPAPRRPLSEATQPDPETTPALPDDDDVIALATGRGNWQLNHLATVFLVLWLVTLVFALIRGATEGTHLRTAATTDAPTRPAIAGE